MLYKSNKTLETSLGALAGTTVVLAVIAICSSDDWLRSNLWILYAIQYVFILRLFFIQKDRWLFMLSPSFVTASYIAINNFLGGYVFSIKIVDSEENYQSHLDWQNLDWIVVFIIFANLFIIFSHFCVGKSRISRTKKLELNDPLSDFFIIIFCIIIILYFAKEDLIFPLFEQGGSFSEIPQTLAGISIVIALKNQKKHIRYVAYLLLIVMFASFSSFDKRISIFLLMPMVLIECLRMEQPRFNIKSLVMMFLLSSVVFMLVIMMSIYRGYGDYDSVSFFDTYKYIFDYMNKDRFVYFIGNNLEYSYIFYHLHQAIEYMLDSQKQLLYGSTFLKILFVFIPRSFVPFKPESIVTHYTQYHDWDLHSAGGSWASTIYADFFWNFHMLGLLGLFVCYYFATRCYFALIYRLRQEVRYQYLLALFAYQYMLTLIRGSGFDLYFVFILVGAVIYLVVFIPVFTISRKLSQMSKHGFGSPTRRSRG